MDQLSVIRTFSWIIAILIALTSSYGLLEHGAYYKETELWAAQARGQDLTNLFIIPFYLFSVLFMNRKRNRFPFIWIGITCYFIYTFLIYCFDIQFNRMFLFYTLISGLLIYSLLFLLYSNKNTWRVTQANSFSDQLTGGYFIFIALFFGGLWLSEIIPANFLNKTPENLEMLPTNPVHVLDLSIVLPGIFLGGFLLIRKKRLGYLLAPVILTFSLLMQLTMGVLMLLLNDYETHPGEITWFTFTLAVTSMLLLIMNLKKNQISL